MHHALEIQEILSNIFAHRHEQKSDLLALATTCRAFKEPALDLLWEELGDLSPLARCLPGAFHLVNCIADNDGDTVDDDDMDNDDAGDIDNMQYSFIRPLTQTEWETLWSYTRRVRSTTSIFLPELDERSLRILSAPPANQPLFPNLRCLNFNSYSSEESIVDESFKIFLSSPNVTSFSIDVDIGIAVNKLILNCICRWQNLRVFQLSPSTSLEFDAFARLARMHALSELCFKQVVPDCTSPLFFSDLRILRLFPASLATASRLLSHILLPTIEDLSIRILDCPSKEDLSCFLANIKICNAGHTIKSLRLSQWSSDTGPQPCSLSLADLRPCMEFSNLCTVGFDINWNVGLTDYELLTLASAWPNLEILRINIVAGWKTQDGLTLNGFLQLLQTCPSLRAVSLGIDTRGYTELSPASPGFTLPHNFSLDVINSIIEAESVPAIVAFFLGMKNLHHLSLVFWRIPSDGPPGWEVYRDRWADVESQIKDSMQLCGRCQIECVPELTDTSSTDG